MIKDVFNQEVEIEEKSGSLWIRPKGELTIVSANIISKNITEKVAEKSLPTVIDMTNVEYIDSASIGVIANLTKAYRKKKLGLYLFNPSKLVTEVLDQVGITKVIRTFHKVEDLPESVR